MKPMNTQSMAMSGKGASLSSMMQDEQEEFAEDAEADEKLTIEQMKSKMRHQGLLIHFFE
jgi:hypothetical protein